MRQDYKRQTQLEPKRIASAINAIQGIGIEITYHDERKVEFMYQDKNVVFYPYSGWHTGQSIKDGRGLQNLLLQLI